MGSTRIRIRLQDDACAAAVELARATAAETAGPGQVGDHISMEPEGDRVVTHFFTCLDPAYRGWRWAVTVARAARAKNVTVDECVLLPGSDALRAPDWVPWRERLEPGDVGIGDLLPVAADDERLVPVVALGGEDAHAASWAGERGAGADEAAVGEIAAPVLQGEILGRARVLSAAGRDETAERWYASDHGPHNPLAHAAPATCSSCGFMVSLAGPLGGVFGACANAYAPDDGRVVSLDHGCGAHSEAAVAAGARQPSVPIIDELGYDIVDHPGISLDDAVFEPLSRG